MLIIGSRGSASLYIKRNLCVFFFECRVFESHLLCHLCLPFPVKQLVLELWDQSCRFTNPNLIYNFLCTFSCSTGWNYSVTPCSFPQLNTPETSSFSFPHFWYYLPTTNRSEKCEEQSRTISFMETMEPILFDLRALSRYTSCTYKSLQWCFNVDIMRFTSLQWYTVKNYKLIKLSLCNFSILLIYKEIFLDLFFWLKYLF